MRWALLYWFVVECGSVQQLNLTLGTQAISIPLPPDFVGLSMEWSSAEKILGHPTFPKVMAHLRAWSDTGSNVRVGGNSADETWWNPTGQRDKNTTCASSYSGKFCITFDMKVSTLQAIQKGVQAMKGSAVLDLVMLQNSTASWAVEEAQAFKDNLNWEGIESLEVGNELDLFPENGARSPQWNVKNYETEWEMYEKALSSILPAKKFFQGGTFCCREDFLTEQVTMIKSWAQSLKSWSFHRYPTSTCGGKTVTVQELLDDQASDGQAEMVHAWVQQSRALGIPFNIGESNSASCGGQRGVSDTLAAALWSLDYLFAMAAVNVTRVNFHGGGSGPYSWFNLQDDGTPQIYPLFYGMSLFQWLTANASRVVELKGAPGPLCAQGIPSGEVCCAKSCGRCGGPGCDTLPGGPDKCCSGTIQHNNRTCVLPSDVGCLFGGLRAKAWAVTDSQSNSRVVVINKNLNESASVRLTAGVNHAQLVVLTAKAVTSPFGLTFAGLTWDGSKAGELVGTFKPVEIDAVSGVLSFDVPPATATLVLLHDSQPPSS